jgi:RPA family protein
MSNGSSGKFAGFEREPAIRVFASELRESRIQFKEGEDEKSPSYVLLPTGARCNRIFLCGQMTQKEKKGEQNKFYTIRVQDPTGTFFINAGSYQPDAMQQIARIEPPVYVAVLGKPGIRTTADSSVFVSVRAESVTEIDLETYRCWVLDCAQQTLDRLDSFDQTDDSRKAKEFYSTNTAIYRQIIHDALTQIEIQ